MECATQARFGLSFIAATSLSITSSVAHEVIPGVTGLPAMILHPMVSNLMLCLLAAGVLAGQQERLGLAFGIRVVTAGLIVGYFSQKLVMHFYGLWRLPLLAAGLAGVVIAIGYQLGRALSAILVGALATIVGLGISPERPGSFGVLEALGGAIVAAGIVLLVCGWPVARLQWHWVQVLARVGGAWIASIAMMVLSLSLR
jgi:hypothetical protein